jgi:hypothetical protein
MDTNVYPDGVPITAPTSPQDDYNDVAVDAQYQYLGKKNSLTLKGTCIWEKQNFGFSSGVTTTGISGGVTTVYPTGANPSDTLAALKVDLTYYYDNKIGATIGYFNTNGSRDVAVYASNADNVPDSNGMVFEANYLPWDNTKFSLQYTYYNKFNGAVDNYDGAGRHATDNDTLMAMAWLMY